MATIKTILAPVDGSKQAQDALREAASLAKTFDAKLIVISVQNDFGMYSQVSDFKTIKEIFAKRTKEELEDDLKIVEALGLNDVETVALDGDPKMEIVNYTEEHPVDLIVVGSTGKGNIERALLGSVSEYIVRHAKSNVLVVR